MRVTAIQTQTQRKRRDWPVRRTEKRRCREKTLPVRGPIHPDPGVCATADAARGEKRLSSGQNQAILRQTAGHLGNVG